MLRILARFIAAVLAAALVFSLVVVAFVRPAGTVLLAPQTYKDVLRSNQVPERLPGVLAETIAKVAAQNGLDQRPAGGRPDGDPGALLASLPAEEIEKLATALLPADEVRAQLESVVDQSFVYLQSDAVKPEIVLSLTGLKQRLAGDAIEQAYLAALPDGPEAGASPETRSRFREAVQEAIKEIPDSADLFAVRDQNQAAQVYAAMNELRSQLQVLGTIARWCWAVPVLLALGVAVFGVRSVRGLLLWWGIPCLLAGGMAALFALPGAAAGSAVYDVLLKSSLPPEAPAFAIEMVVGVISGVVAAVFAPALKFGLWLAVGGFVAIVLSFFFKPKAAAVPPFTSPPPTA